MVGTFRTPPPRPPPSCVDGALALLAPAMALLDRVKNVDRRNGDRWCFRVSEMAHIPAFYKARCMETKAPAERREKPTINDVIEPGERVAGGNEHEGADGEDKEY